MTIAVTRNTPARFKGFLCSCMHEIAPGIYVAPRMKKAVRERIWHVLLKWTELTTEESGIVLLWKSQKAPSGLGIRHIGWPKKELIEHEGTWLTLRDLTAEHDIEELRALAEPNESSSEDDRPDEPSGGGS